MKKTRLIVLNLAIAGLLEIEIAKAQEGTPGLADGPPARASPDEQRRLRLGFEKTLARYQRLVHEGVIDGSEFSWGFTGTTKLTADYRVVAGLEAGLGVGVNGIHWTYDTPQGGGSDSTIIWLSLNPRVGYAVTLAPKLALVPRVGLEYLHGTSWNSAMRLDGSKTDQTHTSRYLSVMSGVLLEYQPAPWFFVAPLVGFGYQVHTNVEGVGSTWFSDQPSESWGLDLKLAAGVRI